MFIIRIGYAGGERVLLKLTELEDANKIFSVLDNEVTIEELILFVETEGGLKDITHIRYDLE